MNSPLTGRRRKLTIVAQDPDVQSGGRILTTQIDVPDEELESGPRGYRVHVVDYDASTRTLYRPLSASAYEGGRDPYERSTLSDDTILNDPRFHAQNAFAIVMRILTRFESALGRRVAWSFAGHQLKVAPHAFADANAFYVNRDGGLLFGYFFPRASKTPVLTSLSHDIVAHETTHALLDGLRARYIDPSSADQAGFHEGFADVVALLSVFASPDVAGFLVDAGGPWKVKAGRIAVSAVKADAIARSSLLGLAEQMGKNMEGARPNALRRSIDLDPGDVANHQDKYAEPHDRGEILVAAIMRAFVQAWVDRLHDLGPDPADTLARERVIEEGCAVADTLLTTAVRAIDYMPPTALLFGDYLSALLTSDQEARPDDSRFELRKKLRESFEQFKIEPASALADGRWELRAEDVSYADVHFESLQRDPEEVFRFVWQNRQTLRLDPAAFTRVISVRPSMRLSPEGFVLREAVAEYLQLIDLEARELLDYGVRKPDGMPDSQAVRLYGGGVLIFDDFGRLKFHIRNRLDNDERQSARLEYLQRSGYFAQRAAVTQPFAALHRQRLLLEQRYREGW